jgi:alkanesulfonate monooxygenase SsuD/methylene tetrahydromethanopterin reductase-like flavin-dependent oxidoreductase (luciferase family)
MERNRGRTLREVGSRFASPETALGLVGTVEQVADRMIEIVDQAGGDGFLFGSSDLNRRTLAEITDGLVPALQDRGAVRDRYDHPMLRENLLQF